MEVAAIIVAVAEVVVAELVAVVAADGVLATVMSGPAVVDAVAAAFAAEVERSEVDEANIFL